MTDPWAIQNNDGNGLRFAISRIERTEKQGKKNTYFEMLILLTPFQPELQVIEQKTFNFSPDWQQVTIPSVMAFVQANKINSPVDMEQDQYVAYRWTEFKSRSKNDINYWQDKEPERIGTDPHGKFVIKRGIEYCELYATEDEWREAANSEAEQPELPVQPEIPQPMIDSMKSVMETKFPDMKAITDFLSKAPFNQFAQLSVQGEIVKREIARLVVEKAGADAEAQEKLLAEINGHFNAGTPYLTAESEELTSQMGEVAF